MVKLLDSLDTLRQDCPGSTEEPSAGILRRGADCLVPGQGDAGRIQRKHHSSPTTTVLASSGPGETHPSPLRSQRERHLNVGQGGSPVPDPSAKPHSVPTSRGLGASEWSSWLALAFIVNQPCLLPYGLSPEAHSGSQSWFQKPLLPLPVGRPPAPSMVL